MNRLAVITRKTKETEISVSLNLDGKGKYEVNTGIPFFDHLLIQISAHGFFDLILNAKGDLEIDSHHTVEDIGLVLGDVCDKSLGDRKGINRYGHSVVPMDETLTSVTVDLSKRPYLVYNIPNNIRRMNNTFGIDISKEFFRAFSFKGGMNLHINVFYGENEHHILESIFKALGRALNIACSMNEKNDGIISTKGLL